LALLAGFAARELAEADRAVERDALLTYLPVIDVRTRLPEDPVRPITSLGRPAFFISFPLVCVGCCMDAKIDVASDVIAPIIPRANLFVYMPV
jgi:hypothetical protein